MQTLTTRLRVSLAPLLIVASLVGPAVHAADEPAAAARLIEQAVKAMRIDPDSSQRRAQQALDLLKKEPNPDLEIRARLILCDYQSEA